MAKSNEGYQEVDHSPLRGPRRIGQYVVPTGVTVVHEVAGDGMKQTRIAGKPNMSAQEWYDTHDVAEAARAAELAKTDRRGDPEYMKQWMPPEQRNELERQEQLGREGQDSQVPPVAPEV